MSQNLSAIASALGGPASGHLVALHQLNEVIIATDGARVGAIVPYILNALAEAGPYEDFGGENEVAVLCVRAITNIVDMDPPACRFLAKPSALAVLQAHIVPSGGVSEVPEAVCKLLATTAVQYPQSVLRSGALATALSAFESLPEARRAVLQALVHATEKVGGREDVALLLDLLPVVIAMVSSWVSTALAGRLSTADWPLLEAAASAVAQLVTSQTRLAFACLQRIAAARRPATAGRRDGAASASLASAQSVDGDRTAAAAAAAPTGLSAAALARSGGGGLGSGSSGGASPPMTTWPVHAVSHMCRLGAPQVLSRVLSLHCSSAARQRAPASPAIAAMLGPGRESLPTGPQICLGHVPLRAVVQAITRVIALQPQLAPRLIVEEDLLQTARLLLAVASQDVGVDAPVALPLLAQARGVAAASTADAAASADERGDEGGDELWSPAAGSQVAAQGRLDDAVALVSALLPQS